MIHACPNNRRLSWINDRLEVRMGYILRSRLKRKKKAKPTLVPPPKKNKCEKLRDHLANLNSKSAFKDADLKIQMWMCVFLSFS